MKNIRISIKVIFLVTVVGLVYLIKVPIPPTTVKSVIYDGETAVQVVPSGAILPVYTNVGGSAKYMSTKTPAPTVVPENPYLGKK